MDAQVEVEFESEKERGADAGGDQGKGKGELPFDGSADFICAYGPFKLVIRARGRRLSRWGMSAELNLLEQREKLQFEDLLELLPKGKAVQVQLRNGNAEGSSSLVSGTIDEIAPRGQQVAVHLRFQKVDEDFEEILAELKPELPL